MYLNGIGLKILSHTKIINEQKEMDIHMVPF